MSFLINSYQFAAVKDPNFANVSLLLHGDGANGSTVIVDSSLNPKTLTAVGNAQISTTNSKFGSGCVLFDGNGDRITVPQNLDFDFGTGNFTIEFWAYKSANGINGYDCVFSNYKNTNTPSFVVELSTSRGFCIVVAPISGGILICSASAAVNDSTWHHWAVCRSGTAWYLFRDGIALAKNQDQILGSSIYTTSFGHLIGSEQDATFYDFNGRLDELRITKGVARYTANFTPPTAPFPDQ